MARRVPGTGMRSTERAPTLSRQAYLQLQQAIRDGELVAGTLYSENEIASTLGMSRTPVREAIIALNREGIVEVSSQRGFQIRQLSPDERAEIFDLRSLLESFVAGRLAASRTDDQVLYLTQLIDSQEKLGAEQASEFLELDEQFHLAQADFLGLDRTRATLENLRGAMWVIGLEALELPTRHADVITEHRAIVNAINNGDAAAAEKATRVHLERTKNASLARSVAHASVPSVLSKA